MSIAYHAIFIALPFCVIDLSYVHNHFVIL